MTQKDRKRFSAIYMSALVVLAFVSVASCITADRSLGAGFVPDDRNLNVKTHSFYVPVGMKMADTLQTNTSYMVIGNISDEQFGRTNVEFAATVTPPDTLPWGKNPVFKKATLKFILLKNQTFSEGQESVPQNIHAYEMLTVMDTSNIYSNSFSRKDYSESEIMDGAVIYTGGDTLTIPLKKSYGERFMKATAEELDSTELFIRNFKGVYVKSDARLVSADGGRLSKFSDAYLYLTFNSTNDSGYTRDTTVAFPVGSYLATEIYTHSSRGLEVDGNNDLKEIYYEGLAGIKPHIDAEAIRDSLVLWFKAEGIDPAKLVVARASLELPYEFPEDYTELETYPKALFPSMRYPYAYNASQYYPLSSIYDSSQNQGDMNRSLEYYRPDITNYIQDLARLIAGEKTSSSTGFGETMNDSWDIWLFNYYTGSEDDDSESESNTGYNSAYYNYLYNSMLYGGYGGYGYGSYGYGYGGYGYGGYGGYGGYDSYYNYMNMMNYYNYYSSSSSSSSSTTVYYVDFINYAKGRINGNGAERRPSIRITYTVLD